MKKLWNGFKIAFSMYSRIPMPESRWNEENQTYAMVFFPWVGAVVAGVFLGVWQLREWALVKGVLESDLFWSGALVLVPFLITGGIHMDGFMDTRDALSACAPRERRLEILKDSHAGAFAIIVCCGYFLAAFGIWTEAGAEDIGVLAVGFILSRALNGFGICTFPCAKNSGLAATFAQAADRKRCQIVLVIEILLCIAGMLLIDPLRGTTAAVAAVVVCLCCRRMAIKTFGGITGDIQGFFLQICELAMAYVVILQ